MGVRHAKTIEPSLRFLTRSWQVCRSLSRSLEMTGEWQDRIVKRWRLILEDLCCFPDLSAYQVHDPAHPTRRCQRTWLIKSTIYKYFPAINLFVPLFRGTRISRLIFAVFCIFEQLKQLFLCGLHLRHHHHYAFPLDLVEGRVIIAVLIMKGW
jgi:hypothetical protein